MSQTSLWLKKNWKPGDQFSANELNKLFAAVERLCNMTASSPLLITHDSAGIHLALDIGALIVEAGGTFILNDASTTNITSNQNNLVIQGPIAPISTNGLYTITGIVPPSASGHMLWVYNAGTYPIVFAHQSASSTAANRFYFWNEQNQILMPGQFLSLHYNVSASRWYIVDFCKPIGGEKLATITLSTDLDDWALLGVANLKLPIIPVDPNGADRLLTGIANPIPGMVIGVRNVNGSDYLIAIKHESSSSTAANRISTPGGNTVPIYPGDVVFFRYDGNSTRWKLDSVPEPLIALPATPTAWGSNQDNLVIANRGRPEQRISASTPVNLTGIVAPLRDGEKLTFINVGSTHPITLIHDSTSTAANRFELPGGLPLILWPGDVVQVRYDLTLTRWTVIYTTAVIIRPEITQSIWGSNQNNWNPAIRSSEEQRISASSAVEITGIVPIRDGERIALRNVGSETITLKNESGSSTAEYRLSLPNSADYPLYAGQTTKLVYDATAARWKLAATTPVVMVGDGGSGGKIGLVPASAAGDAAAGKYLKADGTWVIPPTGSVTVEEVDGSPSYSSITTLSFDSADGFVLSPPGAGIARIDLAEASASQAGIVSTGTQTLGGDKTFADDVAVTQTLTVHQQTYLLSSIAVTGPASFLNTVGLYGSGNVLGSLAVAYSTSDHGLLKFRVYDDSSAAVLNTLDFDEDGLHLDAGVYYCAASAGVTGVRSDGLTTVGGIVTAIGSPSTYSDEQAQDAVGTMVGGTTGLAYDDVTPALSVNVNGLTDVTDWALDDYLPVADASASNATKRGKIERLLGLLRYAPGGRITLTTGDPENLSDATGTTLYYTPYYHDVITLWDGTRWVPVRFAETSLSTGGGGSGGCYDLFGYLSSGALALEKLAWTNSTTRATDITYSGMDGRLCKSGAKDRLYLGTFYQDNAAGTVADTSSSRLLWNMYNRTTKRLRCYKYDPHTYNTTAFRSWNTNTTIGEGKYEFVCGRACLLRNSIYSQGYAATGAAYAYVAAGFDSTTTNDSDLGDTVSHVILNTLTQGVSVGAKHVTGVGYHFIQAVELSYGAGAYFNDVGLVGWMEF